MFLTRRFYIIMTAIILLFVAGFWWRFCYWAAIAIITIIGVMLIIDLILLYHKHGIDANRL